MKSPCDKTCKIYKGVCNGCGRTLNDIKLWGNATESEKRAIIVRAAGGNKMERQIELMRLANKSVFTIARRFLHAIAADSFVDLDRGSGIFSPLSPPVPRLRRCSARGLW